MLRFDGQRLMEVIDNSELRSWLELHADANTTTMLSREEYLLISGL